MEKTPKSKERCVAFVVARLSSSRLAAKHFQLIGDRPLLDWTIDGLKGCRELDQIVLTTVEEPENQPLRDFAEKAGIACFWYRGDPNHVTTRLRKAAEEYAADICLLISGDCPLMEPAAIDALVAQFRRQQHADCLKVELGESGLEPAQEGVGIFRRRAWQRADDLSDRPELKEHQFPLIWRHPELFPVAVATLPETLMFTHHRFSIDTQADLHFMRTLHDELACRRQPFALPQVVQLLRERPELLEINRHVHQRRLVEDIKQVLCVVDAGDGYGYGHLRRSLELAGQLTERLSWPVTFMTDDPPTAKLLQCKGIRVVHGAIGRRTRGGDSAAVGDDFDLCLLDLAVRPMAAGWREQLPARAKLIALDSLAEWTGQADLVVIPGITGPDAVPMDKARLRRGSERIILRREVRQLQPQTIEKDLDLLCYAHSDDREACIAELCRNRNWSFHVVRGHREDFPALLARSRVFLGNFGYSFYEGLALGCHLVAWPLTEKHAGDAGAFFARMGLPVRLAWQTADLEGHIDAALGAGRPGVGLADGTPRIVADVAELFAHPVHGEVVHG